MNRVYSKLATGLLAILTTSLFLPNAQAQGTLPSCPERSIGGGRVATEAGGLASFAFMAFVDPTSETYQGAFHYSDQAAGINVTSTSLEGYAVVSTDVRIIQYAVNGTSGIDEARVILTDAGNGGANDTVVVQLLSSGNLVYQTPENLAAGNLLIHTQLCP